MADNTTYQQEERARRVAQAAQILSQRDKREGILVITGAGISQSAGLRTWRRGGEHPIWAQEQERRLSINAFEADPKGTWEFIAERFIHLEKAPQAHAHLPLARLLRMLKQREEVTLSTQNVDHLHEDAEMLIDQGLGAHGSEPTQVLHVHGRLGWRCIRCQARERLTPEAPTPPELCPKCASKFIRPDTVMFGDPMDKDYAEVLEKVERARVVLVIGTSLEVQPIGAQPIKALKRGAHVIVIDEVLPEALKLYPATSENTTWLMGDAFEVLSELEQATGELLNQNAEENT